MTSDKVPWAKVTVTADAVEKMSELVAENERLRAAAEPEYERLRLALAQYETENERLRAENTSLKQLNVPNDEVFTATRNPYADEVERLRFMKDANVEAKEKLLEENEVLREANQRQDAERIGVMNQRNQAWDEVERLRGYEKEAIRLAFEVERLRTELEESAKREEDEAKAERVRAAGRRLLAEASEFDDEDLTEVCRQFRQALEETT
jgi:hypothetical protein